MVSWVSSSEKGSFSSYSTVWSSTARTSFTCPARHFEGLRVAGSIQRLME